MYACLCIFVRLHIWEIKWNYVDNIDLSNMAYINSQTEKQTDKPFFCFVFIFDYLNSNFSDLGKTRLNENLTFNHHLKIAIFLDSKSH